MISTVSSGARLSQTLPPSRGPTTTTIRVGAPINELIRADGTWSGFERNVFYANNGDGTFSDVSGAVDLDFIEDCRSFALADFDHDGRLEVVLKTRNSPQLRVLKNVVKELSPAIVVSPHRKKEQSRRNRCARCRRYRRDADHPRRCRRDRDSLRSTVKNCSSDSGKRSRP